MPQNIQPQSIRSRVIYVLAAIATIACIWWGIWAFMHYTPPGIVPNSTPMSLIEMEDVVLNGNGDRGREWVVKAARVDVSQDRSTASIKDIKDCVIYRDKKPAARLKAANAVVNLWSKRMSVYGNVRVYNDSGQSLETSAITWEPSTTQLKSSGKVMFKSRDGDVTAEKAELNVSTKEMTLVKPQMSLWIEEVGSLR